VSVLLRRGALRLPVVLGLASLGLVLAPSASGDAQLDTVTVSGSSGPVSPPVESRFGLLSLFDVNINAHSGTSGEDPGGTASFTLGIPSIGGLSASGSVNCLSVTGPDRGGGTTTAPTTAWLRFQDVSGVLFTVGLVDNGGNGADIMGFAEGLAPSPTGCGLSEVFAGPETGTLTNGRAVVFDAPLVPTSKDQCKDGGWRNFPQVKNQGDCVSFVETGK
jgi:hypothetical protein